MLCYGSDRRDCVWTLAPPEGVTAVATQVDIPITWYSASLHKLTDKLKLSNSYRVCSSCFIVLYSLQYVVCVELCPSVLRSSVFCYACIWRSVTDVQCLHNPVTLCARVEQVWWGMKKMCESIAYLRKNLWRTTARIKCFCSTWGLLLSSHIWCTDSIEQWP